MRQCPAKSATKPEDKALAERLLAAPTIPDKTWAPARGAVRNEGETRAQFIRRVLLGEAS
ncbi:MAG: hypothetical protein OEV60_01585 [Actinomycetota bacterium]|nr:hypothetical protein [Actinomycetota bacterium]MDH5225123.1 hypothetical protein [Actinomycetota bacterium]MDH5312615.1 hypothetical protein [Actinomycetota bacterium]